MIGLEKLLELDLPEEARELVREEIEKQKEYTKDMEGRLEKAHYATKLKTEFLANMSHEIRTQLNCVIGYTDLLLGDEKLSDTNKEFLGYVQESGNQLLSLIDDILDLSKIEAGHIRIEKTTCSLDNMLKTIEKTAKTLIFRKGKDLALRRVYPSNIEDNIAADPLRLLQIMNNLMSNAVKFTSEGFIEYGISLRNENVIEFYVRDTEQKTIFEPFKQADVSTTRKYGGTGLGLAISRKLVGLMDGRLNVQSTQGEGHGSTFYFTHPYEPLQSEGPSQIKEERITRTKQEYKILIAEDDKMNMRLTKDMLRSAGFSTATAYDGREAISIYKSDRLIDVVLMDIDMPILDGLKAVEIIRSIEQKEDTHRTPIIAVTAYAMKGDKERCIEAGCDDYIAKPINHKNLIGTIQRYLK